MRSSLLTSILSACLLAACTGDSKDGTDTIPDETSDTTGSVDMDGDGYTTAEDCDDTDAAVNPGASEECDGVDNDCDGEIDDGVTQTYYNDLDGDGFGDSSTTTEACEPTDNWVESDGDCDDGDPYVYPGAEEICDGVDNDCNDIVDDGLENSTYYADSDGDGLGNPDESLDACEMPSGYVDNAIDCDDTNDGEPVWADSLAGSSSGTGSSTNPLDTIQGAIDQATECVFANPGTYYEDITFGGKDILVLGVDGPDSTFIVGTGNTSVVTFDQGESVDAILTGFTISGGTGTVEVTTETSGGTDSYTTATTVTTYRYYGGGIYVNGASPTLYDLVVTENLLPAYSYSNPTSDTSVYVYSYGGGAFLGDTTMDPYSVVFTANYADAGGGAYVNSASTVDAKWMVFQGNAASSGGGATSAGTLTLNNSLLSDNQSDSSGSGVGGAGVDVTGGTVALNQVTGASNEGVASAYLSSGGSLTVHNSILSDNDSGYIVDGEVGTTLDVSYSDLYGGSSGNYGSAYTDPTGSTGNISSDPLFMSFIDNSDYTDDSFYLSSSSPALGAGSSGYDMGDRKSVV